MAASMMSTHAICILLELMMTSHVIALTARQGDVPVSSDIHASITRTGHPTLANRVKDLYSSVFGRAIESGLMEHNPVKGIRDNAEKSRERFLQPSELPRFFAALSAEPNETIRDFVL